MLFDHKNSVNNLEKQERDYESSNNAYIMTLYGTQPSRNFAHEIKTGIFKDE